MPTVRCLALVATFVAITVIPFESTIAGELQAGAATSNITPRIGGDIVGGFAPSPSKHVHDELHARCLVLADGDTKVALVVCDLLGFHRKVSDEARALIEKQSGIPASHVLISATHTHSAQSALTDDRMKFDQKLDEYQTFLVRRIADGVLRAVNNLRPAELGVGTVEAPEHVFNRRWYMRPGTMPPNPFGTSDLVKMNPPGGSPNLVEPAGPTDPTVSFISVRDKEGRTIGIYAAYSLHYVGHVGPAHVSADYFGMFCDRVEKTLGVDAQDPPPVALLANGTSGDINNNNFRTPRPGKKPYEQMRFVADDVAKKVIGSLSNISYRSEVALDARYRELEINLRHPTSEELAWAKKTLEEKDPEALRNRTNLSKIYAERTMKLAEYPEKGNMPIQVVQIGDVCIGSLPCEVFCEIGLEFKRRSQSKPAFMVSIAHGYFGYLPTPRQHELGGYETWIGTNRVERKASEKMLDALVEMSGELKRHSPGTSK